MSEEALRERVEQAIAALRDGGDEALLAYLRGVSPSNESATGLCPGSLRADGPCEHGEFDVHRVRKFIQHTAERAFPEGNRACFMACQESLDGLPCPCNPPLRVSICPLGDDCLADGPSCFAVFYLLSVSVTIES